MRIGCVIGLVLASLATTASAEQSPRGIEEAFASPQAIVVAERGGNGRGRGAVVWRDTLRAPRLLERATRDALRRLDQELPIPPTLRSVSPESEPEPNEEAAQPEPQARTPDPQPTPVVTQAPSLTIAPVRLGQAESQLTRVGVAALLGLGVLLAAFVLSRRRVGRPIPAEIVAAAPLAALPAAIPKVDDGARTTRPRAVIDVAVEEAIAEGPVPFPGGGRYEILEEIGRGGMGVVYKARDKRLDRIVALKRLPDALGSEPRYVELLMREARSAARLNHRNIVTVHDVDRENGAWFITMELLEGDAVEKLLRERGRIAPRSAVWLGEQAMAGLGYAHERGIVHRDVKPANLFLTRDRTVKLMDFGVAKILEEARRKRTLIGGTPAYMAPEQAIGERVDGRADLYAFGAMLFELLTGELPFAKGDPLYHHRLTAPPDPRERTSGIPDALAELVLALLNKRPDERPASATEVATRLRAIATQLAPARRAAAGCVLWIALALASIAAPVRTYAAPPGAIGIAANEAPQPEARGWRRVPDWMKRNLDPRRAFHRDDAEHPTPQAAPAPAPRKSVAKPRVAKATSPKTERPTPPKTVDPLPVSPEPVSPPSGPPAMAPPPELAPVTPPPHGASLALRLGGIGFLLGGLAVAWRLLRRDAPRLATPPVVAAPLVALAQAVEEPDRTLVTQANATIDVAVETAVESAIESADPVASAFPAGGRYEILGELGRGGMGVVYEARDKRLDRIVALKRLPDTLESDRHAVALLLREARSAARLNHRNIVTVHDVDRDEGAWFITMELLEGDLLSTILRQQRRLSVPTVIEIGQQVAAGLAYAHDHGIVHRDVKPSNLFVTRDQTVKLMDFGVAKILEEARRSKTLVGGTPSYMSPEQAVGDAVDGRTDLYALGATLFELLTGEVPFAKGDPIYHHHLTQPPDPRQRAAGIPESLAALVLALLCKRPDERPASAKDVAARLREIAVATQPRVTP